MRGDKKKTTNEYVIREKALWRKKKNTSKEEWLREGASEEASLIR